MKYLVNRETKEHKVATPLAESIIKGYPDFRDDWQLVEADSEGWIPWSGGECPLPKKARCHWRVKMFGDLRMGDDCGEKAKRLAWESTAITHYRPILSETAEKEYTANAAPFEVSDGWKELPLQDDTLYKVKIYSGGGPSVFDRLKSAIDASESIPGIIAEIDALLPGGYHVTKRPTHRNVEI